MDYSADPDQLASSDLDLHCFLEDISGLSRLNYAVCLQII